MRSTIHSVTAVVHYRYLFILLWGIVFPFSLFAQPNLEGSVPTNYTASSGVLSMSSDHYRLGAQSLRWDWTGGDTLKITGLNLTNTFTWGINTFGAWVYNENAAPDQFKFHFINTSNTLKFSFNYLANYTGWRWAVQSYRFDMTQGPGTWTVKTIHIVAPPTGSGTLFFDDFSYERSTVNGMADNQMPYLPNNAIYQDYTRPPAVPLATPTAQELTDLALIRSRFLPVNPFSAPTATELTNAITAYDTWNIVLTGSQIKGKTINDPSEIGNILMVFARDWWKNGAEPSRQRAENLIRLLLDGGFAGGSRAWIAGGSSGYDDRTFFSALKYFSNGAFSPNLNAQVKDWLYWTGQIGIGWLDKPDQNGRHNTDNIHVLYDLYFCTVFFSETNDEKVLMLKCLKRLFEGFCQHHEGTSDGMKVDGPGFHHGAHHNAYMYALTTFASPILTRLHQTSFQIDSASYVTFRKAVVALDISKNGGNYGNSLCGRAPFTTTTGMNPTEISQMVTTGGWILNQPYDTDLAAYRNRRYGVDPAFSGTPPAPPLNGFWQMNYSPLGIYRNGSWLASIRGHSSYFWGTEIYDGSNRYGRYQSFGAIEIIYSGGAVASGFRKEGWNWNMPPGTTTVHLPFNLLNPPSTRHDEYNDAPFTGGLRLAEINDNLQLQRGQYGVYGYRLQQRNYTNTSFLKARKSVFCVGGRMVCLGSDISSPDNRGSVATNLFQGTLATTSTPVSVDGAAVGSFPYSANLTSSSGHWLKDAFGTGYYILPGSGDIVVGRQAQTSPDQNGTAAVTTGNFATAYLDHGIQASNARYEYVVAPEISDAAFTLLKDSLSNTATRFYEVRKQDSMAHIVYFRQERIEAAVFFAANPALDTGLVRSCSHSALLMTRMKGDTLLVSMDNPDVNLNANIAEEEVIDIRFKGIWEVLQKDDRVEVMTINASGTTLRFRTIHGLPLDAVLLLTQPTAGIVPVPGGCQGSAPANDGRLVLTTLTGADRYGISPGNTYTGPVYAAAQIVPTVLPTDLVAGLLNNQAATYTVRFYNGADTVFTQYVVTVPAAQPHCPLDPTGYIYCEETGVVIPGGNIQVSGPGAIVLTQNGGSGFYQFFTDGTPGIYTMTVTPPAGYSFSTTRGALPAIDPTGQPNPYLVGSGSSTGLVLDNFSEAANPYTFTFSLATGDPDVLLNNIPLVCCDAPLLTVTSSTVCRGTAVDLSTLVTSTGGGGLSYYLTQTAAELGTNALASPTVTVATASNYYVRSQSNSCYTVKEITVNIRSGNCSMIQISGSH